jgi:hypothetical protein
MISDASGVPELKVDPNPDLDLALFHSRLHFVFFNKPLFHASGYLSMLGQPLSAVDVSRWPSR